MKSSIDNTVCQTDNKFTLGLTYCEIMDLSQKELDLFLNYCTREEIVAWLEWNDPNGIYGDKVSLREYGNILSKEEGKEVIKRQIGQG